MDLAICSIQRERAQWLREWVAFHHVVGFRKFYIYLHRCTDDSAKVVAELSRFFNITTFIMPDDVQRPQLVAYQHCYQQYGSLHDWIAFIDGDEFLFSPHGINVGNQLAAFSPHQCSAIGVYWVCFGSSGHQSEPCGYVIDNYRWRSTFDFPPNRHFKSIVRGRLGAAFSLANNAHFFNTPHGTCDTAGRTLTGGYAEHEPVYSRLRINHYATQSRNFFVHFKQKSGAADARADLVRSEEWWLEYDRNDCWDESLQHLKDELMYTINASRICA